jgi:hypothetical protein
VELGDFIFGSKVGPWIKALSRLFEKLLDRFAFFDEAAATHWMVFLDASDLLDFLRVLVEFHREVSPVAAVETHGGELLHGFGHSHQLEHLPERLWLAVGTLRSNVASRAATMTILPSSAHFCVNSTICLRAAYVLEELPFVNGNHVEVVDQPHHFLQKLDFAGRDEQPR